MKKELSPRWRESTPEERSRAMSALASRRMQLLTRAQRVKIAHDLVAARKKKHAH